MSISSTAVRPTTKTRIPATAESPASSRIKLKTNDVSHTAGPAEPDDAGERRPDRRPGCTSPTSRPSRPGARRWRRDPERGQDPLPADDEEQVVGGYYGQGGEEEERIDILEQRDRLAYVSRTAWRGTPAPRLEGDLQADEHAPAAKERGKPARHVSESRAKGRQTRIRPSAVRDGRRSGRTLAGVNYDAIVEADELLAGKPFTDPENTEREVGVMPEARARACDARARRGRQRELDPREHDEDGPPPSDRRPRHTGVASSRRRHGRGSLASRGTRSTTRSSSTSRMRSSSACRTTRPRALELLRRRASSRAPTGTSSSSPRPTCPLSGTGTRCTAARRRCPPPLPRGALH